MTTIRVLSGQAVAYDLQLADGYDPQANYRLSGPDAALFEITANGLIRFKEAPDFNVVGDASSDNIYEISILSDAGELISLDAKVVPQTTAQDEERINTAPDSRLGDLIHTGAGGRVLSQWGDGDTSADAGTLIITWSIFDRNSSLDGYDTRHLSSDFRDFLDDTPPTDTEIAAISALFKQWSDYANVEFVYVDEGVDASHGDVRLFFTDQGGTGIAWPAGLYDGTQINGDIFIRPDLRAGLTEDGANFSKHILLHEIGHAAFSLTDVTTEEGISGDQLRWEFNNQAWTIQSYLPDGPRFHPGLIFAQSPQLLDVKVAQFLFGADQDTGAGHTHYRLDENSYTTIYDVSGTDSLIFNKANAPLKLDLREGTVSRLGAAGHVAIAAGTVIENVVGTVFDDEVYLNDANNRIWTGFGDDVIYGATNADFIDGGEGFDAVYLDAESTDGINVDAIRNVEIVYLNDGAFNFSDLEGYSSATEAGTVYVSIDEASFDRTIWNLDEDDSLGSVRITDPFPQTFTPSPASDAENVRITSGGQIYVAANVVDGQTVTVTAEHAADQTIQFSAAADNIYRIDLPNADPQIDIYDYDGEDRLVLDNFDGWYISDSFVRDGSTFISLSKGNKDVEIVIHNSQGVGHIERLITRFADGRQQAFLIAPSDRIFELAFNQRANGLEIDFTDDGSIGYFLPGRRNGVENQERTSTNQDLVDEFSVVYQGGNDLIFGSAGDDQLEGYEGNDVIKGGSGSDYLNGGFGDDIIYGEDGNDSIFADFQGGSPDGAGQGNDLVRAGAGNDYVRAGGGDDVVYLGAGDDRLDELSTTVGGNDRVYGEAGNDYLNAGNGNDMLYGGTGNDTVYANAGDDFIDGGPGNDYVRAGEGDDVVYLGAGDDRLSELSSIVGGNDRVYGEAGNDYLSAGNGNDMLYGGTGNDTVYANAGDDIIDGGPGNDYVRAGEGDDIIDGGPGDDELYGGEGADVFVFKANSGIDFIRDFDPLRDALDLSDTAAEIDSLAELLAHASDTSSGLQIDLGGGNSVLLAGTSRGDIDDGWLLS